MSRKRAREAHHAAHEASRADNCARCACTGRRQPIRRRPAAKVREAMPLNAEEVEDVVADFDALRRGLPLPSRSHR